MKQLPNVISTSGLSSDYRLAFGSLSNYIERTQEDNLPRTRHLALKAFKHRHIKNYLEYFDPQVYSNVLTEKNKSAVDKISQQIELLNEIRLNEDVDLNQLMEIHQCLTDLLSGKVL